MGKRRLGIIGVTEHIFVEPQDAIVPTTIVHDVGDLRSVDPGAFYNFLTYTFERDSLSVQARTYLDAIHEASVLTERPPSGEVAVRFIEDVVAYLKRRYGSVVLMHEMSDHD